MRCWAGQPPEVATCSSATGQSLQGFSTASGSRRAPAASSVDGWLHGSAVEDSPVSARRSQHHQKPVFSTQSPRPQVRGSKGSGQRRTPGSAGVGMPVELARCRLIWTPAGKEKAVKPLPSTEPTLVAASGGRPGPITHARVPQGEEIINNFMLMGHENVNYNINVASGVAGGHASPMHSRTTQQPRISQHAVDRYRQRVANVTPGEAARRLADLAADATRRPTPRRWTGAAPGPGVLFLYPHADSDICLVLKRSTVVTVFSRVACIAWRTQRDSGSRRPARRQPYRRPSPGALPMEAA